jgi:cation transport ATPase
MSRKAHVQHHIRGRMRVKVPAGKGNPNLLEEIRRSLTPMPGVQSVEINAVTGSVVVHYDHREHADFHQSLTEHALEQGHFELQPPHLTEIDEIAENIEKEAEFLAEHSELARTMVGAVKSFDAGLKRATNNNLDLKVLLPLGLAVYAFLEVGAEASTPLWVTLGIFSFNSFISLHPPLPGVAVHTQQVIQETPEGSVIEHRDTTRERMT